MSSGMKETTAKEKILKKIRTALIQKTDQPFPQVDTTTSPYPAPADSLDVIFAQELTKAQGNFVYCETATECVANLNTLSDSKNWSHLYCWDTTLQELFIKHDFRKSRIGKNIDKADAGITLCEALIARTGTVLISSKLAAGRTLSIFPPVHIVIATPKQLVFDIQDGLEIISKKYKADLPSMISIVTGPSRTADIEKTIVLGAHGPKEIYVFLIDNMKK